MSNVAVIGGQWGDEGKGKIVDMLAGAHDAVVRFNGGANAGHSVVVRGERFAICARRGCADDHEQAPRKLSHSNPYPCIARQYPPSGRPAGATSRSFRSTIRG